MIAWLRIVALLLLAVPATADATEAHARPAEPVVVVTIGQLRSDEQPAIPDSIGGLNNTDQTLAPRVRLRLFQLRSPGETRWDESVLPTGGAAAWAPVPGRNVSTFTVRIHPDPHDTFRNLLLRSGAFSSFSTSLPPPSLG